MVYKSISISQEESKFSDYLKSKGLRFTPERQIILQEVFSFHKHFDVEEIFEKLREKGNPICRATIYRTLPLLAESGLIKEALHCENRIHYEYVSGRGHHDHLLCVKCGKIIELKGEVVEKLRKAIREKYAFESMKLGVRGYCKKCYGSLAIK